MNYQNNKNISQEEKVKLQKFKKDTFTGKKIVFIIAKNWGTAKLFFSKTMLCRYSNIRIEYLFKMQQLFTVNSPDVIVIQLPRALETQQNLPLFPLLKQQNIKIVNFELPYETWEYNED